MVPGLTHFKVNLGKWRPELGSDVAQCFPPMTSLKKAPFWCHENFKVVRQLLSKEPLQTSTESIGNDVAQVRLGNSGARIQCWTGQGGMPAETRHLPFRCVVFNLLNIRLDALDGLQSLPCQRLLVELPVLVLGKPREVDSLVDTISRIIGREWAGQKRYIDVYTQDAPDAVWFWAKRKLCMMLPSNINCPKVFVFQ